MRLKALTILAFLLASPAMAGETAWQEVAPGVSLRLISAGQIKANGTMLLGLELAMPETTKTYWRVPGDTGLLTELDFSASAGVLAHRILWPYPTRQDEPDYLDYVYFGPTVLPIEVTLQPETSEVQVTAVLGVCSDICVPAQASFALPLLEAGPDRPNGLRIRQALATWPMPWEDDPQPIGDIAYDAAAGMLQVWVDPQVDPASLIASTISGEPLFGTPQKGLQANLILIPVLRNDDQINLEGQDVQLTFMTGMGAFEVSRPIKALR